MEKKLTPKQILFCKEYLKDLNATQAAIRAGYSEKTAKEIGCQNLTKVNVQEYLSKQLSERIEKIDLTVENVLNDIMETRKEAAQSEKLSERLKANEMLGKYLKMFTESVDHSGDLNININKKVLSARDND